MLSFLLGKRLREKPEFIFAESCSSKEASKFLRKYEDIFVLEAFLARCASHNRPVSRCLAGPGSASTRHRLRVVLHGYL